jgi:hypothetical protein
LHSPEHIRRFCAIAEPGAEYILNHFASELQPHWPDMVRAFYAHHLQAMIEGAHNANGFTLIHGDVGHNNILIPRTGAWPRYASSVNWMRRARGSCAPR